MKTLLYSKVATVVLVVAVSGLVYQAIKVVYRSYDTIRDITKLKDEVESLQSQQKKLEKFRTFIQTDFFAEKEARLKLGMQKAGEHVVVVPPYAGSSENEEDAPPSSGPLTISDVPEEKKKNTALWWDYFFAQERN